MVKCVVLLVTASWKRVHLYPKVKYLCQELCKLNYYFTLDFFSSHCEFLGDALL